MSDERDDLNSQSGAPSPYHRMGGDTWRILDYMRWRGWQATALALNDLGMLNYRGRISDLRHKFALEIETIQRRSETTNKLITTYYIPAHHHTRAEWLWRRRSLEGYAIEPYQRKVF